MRSLSVFFCLASLLLACGSSSAPKAAEDPAVGPGGELSAAQVEETPEQKLARQQIDAVDKMCQRFTDCALEDARREMSPEGLADLEANLAVTVTKAVADCAQEYAAPMSPRQVISIRECLGEATECSIFGECVAKALQPE